MKLHWISESSAVDNFPDVSQALDDPPGLLAAGGDLSIDRLLAAYQRGIFPWYEEGQPILWWCPDPRAVLFPDELHISRSLARTLRKKLFRVSIDRDFNGVLKGCSAKRAGQQGTWITAAMKTAYQAMFQAGHAHSIECWHEDELVGGIYGVSLGRIFFGESMFAKKSDASKVALVKLVQHLQDRGYELMDCQFITAHLTTMGVREIPRNDFVSRVRRLG
ncbi:MAG: leucyl/phenylalanyl-tRNA--protein transferase, partial [Gammaproteobacteria bacterium]|nr:leucyl/phenylalanyl-tRNA--protein transferase [Gammaproteobacteria bacterium]